jgi:hypothetical protein
MVTERGSRIVVLAVVLFAASAVQSSIAKEARLHGARHAGATGEAAASKNGAVVTKKAGPANGASSAATKPSDTIDMGVTNLTPRLAQAPDRSPKETPSLKIAKPQNFPAFRPALSIAAGRNAIGQPIARPATPPSDGRRPGFAAKTSVAGFDSSGAATAGEALGASNPGRQNFRPPASVIAPSRGKSDGASVIRPSPARSGIGGPATTVAGINGTAFRPKR